MSCYIALTGLLSIVSSKLASNSQLGLNHMPPFPVASLFRLTFTCYFIAENIYIIFFMQLINGTLFVDYFNISKLYVCVCVCR